ncbi:MAG: TRAP transporter substrate-binding protein DctP [Desulfobacteraceae bacterium]|jgi:TRAP-type transport system periplasmic protein|nr:TRAP transporter substrate-binding protein DctP [Desulfobacteraceae bacterium]MDH3574823.1 TRAP transporter substrate-binding protein DctP [Desulfobacteraceae bacterium]MDH3722830.1 TRAP transporter substrate-binding protein DctP [Desulfobacteraceae bacterium]MDH3837847.1 TRAP transporter substrate-binding protein DctP [Desulfobacteraceae bacterium]MDH3875312.1 TRAP transporter substrate-binding protein DctP [Desulfobacteraceae bacterium]
MIRIIAFILIVMLTGQAQAIQIKIATISPEGSVWMEKMREGAEELARKTNNRVEMKFYPGGVMGDDKAVLRKIRIGQLQGGAFVSGSLSQFYPDNQIYSLPLFFRSFKEIDYVRERLDKKIIDGFEKGGFVIFGIAEGGFAYVMSTVPIHSVDDMRQQKVWIPDNDSMILEAIKAFDIRPIPLSIADVRAGLQTSLINTVTTPPIGALALQWHTQIKYLMDEPFLYIYGVLAVDRKAFKRISTGDQQIFREIMGEVFKDLDRRNREDNIKAVEALRKQGIEFIKPSPEALKKWCKDASEVPNRLVKADRLSQEMVDTLENLLKEYRLKEGVQNP